MTFLWPCLSSSLESVLKLLLGAAGYRDDTSPKEVTLKFFQRFSLLFSMLFFSLLFFCFAVSAGFLFDGELCLCCQTNQLVGMHSSRYCCVFANYKKTQTGLQENYPYLSKDILSPGWGNPNFWSSQQPNTWLSSECGSKDEAHYFSRIFCKNHFTCRIILNISCFIKFLIILQFCIFATVAAHVTCWHLCQLH